MGSEKKIVTALLLGGLWLSGAGLRTQAGPAEKVLQNAREKADAGQYRDAIALYRRALAAQSSPQGKTKVREALDAVTRDYFADLYQRARETKDREERIRLLEEGRKLDLRGWLGTDFEKVVVATQGLINELFGQLQQEADDALRQRALDRALALYDEARALDPQAFEREELAKSYRRAREERDQARRLALQGEEFLARGEYGKARKALEQAKAIFPGEKTVQAGLARLRALPFLEKGQQLAALREFHRAEEAYRQALEADPGNKQARRLLDRSQRYLEQVHLARTEYRQGKCREAQSDLSKAEALDPERFRQDRLKSVLGGDCSRALPLPRTELREALLELFDGNLRGAIQMMEALSSQLGDSHAQIPAFLGVAYCYQAFTQADSEEESLEKARRQFRAALHADPQFHLSQRLFSPRVVKIFEQVRAEGGQ